MFLLCYKNLLLKIHNGFFFSILFFLCHLYYLQETFCFLWRFGRFFFSSFELLLGSVRGKKGFNRSSIWIILYEFSIWLTFLIVAAYLLVFCSAHQLRLQFHRPAKWSESTVKFCRFLRYINKYFSPSATTSPTDPFALCVSAIVGRILPISFLFLQALCAWLRLLSCNYESSNEFQNREMAFSRCIITSVLRIVCVRFRLL